MFTAFFHDGQRDIRIVNNAFFIRSNSRIGVRWGWKNHHSKLIKVSDWCEHLHVHDVVFSTDQSPQYFERYLNKNEKKRIITKQKHIILEQYWLDYYTSGRLNSSGVGWGDITPPRDLVFLQSVKLNILFIIYILYIYL